MGGGERRKNRGACAACRQRPDRTSAAGCATASVCAQQPRRCDAPSRCSLLLPAATTVSVRRLAGRATRAGRTALTTPEAASGRGRGGGSGAGVKRPGRPRTTLQVVNVGTINNDKSQCNIPQSAPTGAGVTAARRGAGVTGQPRRRARAPQSARTALTKHRHEALPNILLSEKGCRRFPMPASARRMGSR